MKYLIISVFLLLSIQAVGQVEMNWGIGISYNTHFFVHEDKSQFEYSFFQPDVAHLPRINGHFDLNTNSAFQFRCNLSFGEKRIILSNRQRISSGGILKNSIKHEIISADLSVLSYYALNRKVGELRPIVGFYISTNKYVAIAQSTSIRGRGPNHIDESMTPPVTLEVTERPLIVYVGINLGLNYSIKIRKREVEFFSLLYFSPFDMFSSDFSYLANFQEETLNGKYHYLSLGINLKLNRK